MAGSRADFNYRHLLLVGIGLPAGLALANQAILRSENIRYLDAFYFNGILAVPLFAFYVLQVSTISWAAASLRPWPMRWIVYAWIMLLVDLQLSFLTHSVYSPAVFCLASGVFAAQLSLFVVWGILGRGELLWRLPSLGVLLLIYWNFYQTLVTMGRGPGYSSGWQWSDLVLMQTVLLSLVCGALRGIGFSLAVVPEASLRVPAARTSKRSVQFEIRDVLIGTTSLAVVLALAKAGDLLTFRFVRYLYDHGLLLVLTIASATAAVLIVALWAALGRGNAAARVITLLAVSLGVGWPLGWYCARQWAVARGTASWWFWQWYEIGYWWLGWMFLTGTLLAASLVIFRLLGYRLARWVEFGEA